MFNYFAHAGHDHDAAETEAHTEQTTTKPDTSTAQNIVGGMEGILVLFVVVAVVYYLSGKKKD